MNLTREWEGEGGRTHPLYSRYMPSTLSLLEIKVICGEAVVELLYQFVIGHGFIDQLLMLFQFLRDGLHPFLLLGEILDAVWFVVETAGDGFELFTGLENISNSM